MSRSAIRRAYYGAAVAADLAAEIGLLTLGTNDDTTLAGVFNPASNQRALRPYVLQKTWLSGDRFKTIWYFGKCQDANGRRIPGTERLSNYPMRIFDDAGNGGYGALCLGKQAANGRMVVTGARTALVWTISNANTAGTGIAAAGGQVGTDWAIGTATFATNNTHAALTTTKGNVIASTASDPTTLTASTTLALLSAVNTTITDSSGGTASTTFAAITATVTSTVVADALAQLAANENKRLGLMGLVMDGTTTAQSLFLNVICDDADQDGGSDNGLSGEFLLNGTVEVRGFLEGDV
jgi:hypothetical protein